MAEQNIHSSFHAMAAAGFVGGSTFDMSNRLARDQIARYMASSSARRQQQQQQQQQQSRIFKPVSTGNSPQNLSRRRQAAGPRLASQLPDSNQSSRRRAATSTSGRGLAGGSGSRPSSWHPNTAFVDGRGMYGVRHSMYEVQQSLDPYQAMAMSGLATPMTQMQAGGMMMDGSISLASSPEFPTEYAHVPVSSDWAVGGISATQLLTPYSNAQSTQAGYTTEFTQSSFMMYHQAPAAMMSSGDLRVRTAPQTPDTTFTQEYSEQSQDLTPDETPEEDDGPELVGMGLYDSTPDDEPWEGRSMGALNGGPPAGSTKMPKLCDAWTPPEDEDGSEDGDADDDDEDDNEEDDVADDDAEDEAEPKEDLSPYDGGNRLPNPEVTGKSFLLDEAESLDATPLTEMTMSDWRMMSTTWS